jgi:hypothetical protein
MSALAAAVRSTTNNWCIRTQVVRSNAGSAFERTPMTCQPINRTLGPFVRELYFWACFREQFATIGPPLTFSLYLFTLV